MDLAVTGARFVHMQAVLEAMGTRPGPARFFLDLDSGAVVLSLDEPDAASAGEAGGGEPAAQASGRVVEIPRRLEAAAAATRRFLETVGDEPLRARLAAALADEEAGALGAVGRALAADPLRAVALRRAVREALLEAALTWLHRLGIEPMYELPPIAAPLRWAREEPAAGLWELLLLGAPLPVPASAARAGRRLVARDPEQARRLFVRVARDLAARAGLPASAPDGDRFELEGVRLAQKGRVIELEADLPAAVVALFGGASEEGEALVELDATDRDARNRDADADADDGDSRDERGL